MSNLCKENDVTTIKLWVDLPVLLIGIWVSKLKQHFAHCTSRYYYLFLAHCTSLQHVPFSLHPDKKWQWIIILINIATCEVLSVFFAFQAISTILDKQSMLFVDTADMLARMSRETLVKARWGRSASSEKFMSSLIMCNEMPSCVVCQWLILVVQPCMHQIRSMCSFCNSHPDKSV